MKVKLSVLLNKVDYLVVGGGLAGVLLSYLIRQQGQTVMMVDMVKANSASRLSAGVFNPVAYRKLKSVEFADILIPEVFDLYPKIEKQIGVNIFHPGPFLKLLTSIEELNNWQVQSAVESCRQFMLKTIYKGNFDGTIKNPYGAGQIQQSGVVNLLVLIDAWKRVLELEGYLLNEVFEYNELDISNKSFIYKNVFASKIVFCEGIGVENNPWFNWLPMQQFKGEVIEISAPSLKLSRLVNRGVFVLPLPSGFFKVGATHNWKSINEKPSEEGKAELLEKLDKILNVPYEVVKHEAGLRPATRDRTPFIGEHPNISDMYVLNGLGSKGVIMAPWLAKVFLKGIEEKNWPARFDIKRYLRFYKKEK